MRQEAKRLVAKILRDYPNLSEEIRKRENELMNPIREVDTNVGGGRAQNHPWTYHDNIVITIDEDKLIRTLKREQHVIDDCLDEAGDETVKIIKNVYMKKHPDTIKGLISQNKLWCGTTKAYKLRDQFIEEVAKRLGLAFY